MFHSAHAPGVLPVGADEIGIACRYKSGVYAPSLAGGQVDLILPRGVPVGFAPLRAPIARGRARDAEAMLREAPEFMRAHAARDRQCPTTFCVLRVGESRAADFAMAWADLAERPPFFVAFAGSAIRAIAGALMRAGVLPHRWPAPGSPDALFRALHAEHPTARVVVGFADFRPGPAGGCIIRLEG